MKELDDNLFKDFLPVSKLVNSVNITQDLLDVADAVSHDIFINNMPNTKLVDQFEAITKDTIDEMVEYGAVINTKKNTDNWVKTRIDPVFLGLCHKDKEPYSPKSIYNCYCAIAHYLKDNSLMHPYPNLFDETCYVSGLQVIIPREKNNTRGIKNLDNTGCKCEIPPDQDGKFTPVADILYYINKHPSGFITQEFFLQIACKKDNLRGIWFVDNSLGWYSYENMIREICKVTGISMYLRKITNYSLCHIAIQILTELNIATDHIMPFSGHRTLNSVMFYQTFMPQKESHDKDYGNKEESHDDGNKNKDANKKKRIPLAPLPSNIESNSYNSRKKCKVLKTPHDWSKPFKILYCTSSKQTSPALQESNNKDRNKPLNNSVMPQIDINNCKNISVNITIIYS
ncbi:11185_t:CDS:2 [Dentiscutata heterogama]|uniref:11185_t:CDS:1 n=1 Tax=Dentiscutata heterogama TaxID=1316150 RepID=A0ACA9L4H5_9GLOM|nr:11185_t:CDS:2 [Dentiscutata heterogama]